VKLHRNQAKAVGQLSDNLLHWSEYTRRKCKARLVRIHGYLARQRKMKLEARQPKIIPLQVWRALRAEKKTKLKLCGRKRKKFYWREYGTDIGTELGDLL
jgi:hypothetical protein